MLGLRVRHLGQDSYTSKRAIFSSGIREQKVLSCLEGSTGDSLAFDFSGGSCFFGELSAYRQIWVLSGNENTKEFAQATGKDVSVGKEDPDHPDFLLKRKVFQSFIDRVKERDAKPETLQLVIAAGLSNTLHANRLLLALQGNLEVGFAKSDSVGELTGLHFYYDDVKRYTMLDLTPTESGPLPEKAFLKTFSPFGALGTVKDLHGKVAPGQQALGTAESRDSITTGTDSEFEFTFEVISSSEVTGCFTDPLVGDAIGAAAIVVATDSCKNRAMAVLPRNEKEQLVLDGNIYRYFGDTTTAHKLFSSIAIFLSK